jgi:CRP/FNR family transcriptional regulator, cyclic AMP receptor protein
MTAEAATAVTGGCLKTLRHGCRVFSNLFAHLGFARHKTGAARTCHPSHQGRTSDSFLANPERCHGPYGDNEGTPQSLIRQTMDEPILTMDEREAINGGRWFNSLSPSLRHDILRCAYVKRFKDSGKQITLTYVEPGVWFGDVAMFDGDQRTHDAYAHDATTLLCVSRNDFQKILSNHGELYEALMRLQARRIRTLFGLVEDLNTLPLRSRLAKQLLHLVRSYGVPCLSDGNEMRIGLQLAQEELAQLLGASRQRVNQELKAMERDNAIRIEQGGLVIRDRNMLMRIAEAES